MADKQIVPPSLTPCPILPPMFRQSLVRLSNPSRTLATHAATAVRPQQEEPAFAPQRWKRSQVEEIFNSPLLNLVFRSASVHRQNHDPSKIQLCTLLNIKSEFRVHTTLDSFVPLTPFTIHFSRRMF